MSSEENWLGAVQLQVDFCHWFSWLQSCNVRSFSQVIRIDVVQAAVYMIWCVFSKVCHPIDFWLKKIQLIIRRRDLMCRIRVTTLADGDLFDRTQV